MANPAPAARRRHSYQAKKSPTNWLAEHQIALPPGPVRIAADAGLSLEFYKRLADAPYFSAAANTDYLMQRYLAPGGLLHLLATPDGAWHRWHEGAWRRVSDDSIQQAVFSCTQQPNSKKVREILYLLRGRCAWPQTKFEDFT